MPYLCYELTIDLEFEKRKWRYRWSSSPPWHLHRSWYSISQGNYGLVGIFCQTATKTKVEFMRDFEPHDLWSQVQLVYTCSRKPKLSSHEVNLQSLKCTCTLYGPESISSNRVIVYASVIRLSTRRKHTRGKGSCLVVCFSNPATHSSIGCIV